MADRALAVVQMADVRFTWPGRARFTLAIAGFAIARGERLLLVGPSGSGKSTLLSLLCGVVVPDAGTITVLDRDLTKLSGTARDRFRGEHFGILFQMFNLLPYADALDNVLLSLAFAPARRARVAASAEEARRLLRALGVDEALFRGTKAAALSVGQQQRVAAARALIGAPELIVADEPTSALDRDNQLAFLDLLFAEAARAGATVVLVSHDRTLSSRFDRVLDIADIASVSRAAA